MKKTLLMALCLLATPAFAKTEFSKLVNYVQTKYADNFKDYPILIFDIDEVEYRYAQANAFGESKEKEKQRTQIVKKYVQEKTGIELSDNEAGTYEMYTTVLKEGAYAMPTLMDGPDRRKVFKMCAVFPAAPNSNQRLETERITGLTTPGAYKEVSYEGLKKKMSYEEMQAFSLYHELGHCMDQVFMPHNYNTYEVGAHDVHMSESYAEVFALMMLEREGLKGTGQTRALLRNLYTQEMGKWFIDNPGNGFGNPLYLKGGVIYYLAPSLLATNEFVKRHRDFVQGPVEDLLSKAKEIVDEHALEGRSFHGIFRALSEERENVLEMYREFSFTNPSFFRTAYRDILRFLDFSPYLYDMIAGFAPNQDEGIEAAALEAADYCAMEKEELSIYIQEKRSELKEVSFSYESQKKRREELNSFFESYSKCNL